MMNKKNIYILMYKDYEILSFIVDLRKSNIVFLEKLEHFDKAPHGFDKDDELSHKLNNFFASRSIPCQRRGYKQILKATHSRNGFNLIFKGHGLSLSNHYWFRKHNEKLSYKDINFFTNKWDDSFGRALLSEDYDALANASLNVPDILTPGWGVKGWLYDEKRGPRLYKIGINENNSEEALGEVLASRLAQRIFKKDEVLQYELEIIDGKYASVSSPLIGIDEELISLSIYLSFELNRLYYGIRNNKSLLKVFLNKLKKEGYSDLYTFFVKLNCLKSLCFVSDLHFGNVSVIKNISTGNVRVAPLYDLGGSFGSGNTAKKFLANVDKSTLLLIYYLYSNLDPEWDYSWYDKDRLIGFEDEIKNVLSKSSFYTPKIIDFVISIYHQQKESLDELTSKIVK